MYLYSMVFFRKGETVSHFTVCVVVKLLRVFLLLKQKMLRMFMNFTYTLHAKLKRINASSQYKISLR